MLDIICEHCGRALRIPEKYLGQRGKCNHCQGVITVTVAPLKCSPEAPKVSEVPNESGVRDEVLEAARANCETRAGDVSDQMCDQLAEKITNGLKLGLGVEGTARLLREGLGLDAPRAERLEKYRQSLIDKGITGEKLDRMVEKEKSHLINERARSIAAYEMGRALEEGGFKIAKKGGDTHKACITTGAKDVCDTCLANEAVGFIPIDEPFPSGHYSSPFHEDCLCTMGFLMDMGAGELERGQARASKRYAETKAARAPKEA